MRQYLVEGVLNPVATQDLAQVLRTLHDFLRATVWQGVVLIWKLILDR